MGCGCVKGKEYIVKESEKDWIDERQGYNNTEMVERATYIFLQDLYRIVKFKLKFSL